MSSPAERGSAMLLVVGATAAISVLALAALTASAIVYEIAVLRHAGVQARLLAESALDNALAGLSAGAIMPPAGGAPTIWSAPPPAPPAGFPPLGARCGSRVVLTAVRVAGVPRSAQSARLAGARLLDATAEGWCGRGQHAVTARVALAPGGAAVRLY